MSLKTHSKGNLEGLQKAREAQKGKPVIRRNPWERHLDNPMSLRASIDCMCYQCISGVGFPEDKPEPNWRLEIANCTSVTCGLFTVRPFKNDKETLEDTDVPEDH